jgi:ABC-2 type transport system permease protein
MTRVETLPHPAAADAPAPGPRPALLLPAISLARRELVRFLRQRNRIIGALATPIVFWLLIGAGMGRSFQVEGLPDGQNYIQFFFPGTIVMILLFTAVFSTISIIEDRREGFLQSVLVAPVPKLAIALGKVLGGTVLATGQALLFLLLAPLVGIPLSVMTFLAALGAMVLVAFALTGLGFCIAWRMTSTQAFHAIMNLLLMPMWFLSGALFPPQGALAGLGWIMWLNPLTYGLALLRHILYWGQPMPQLPGLAVSLVVTVGFATAMLLLSAALVGTRTNADLQ